MAQRVHEFRATITEGHTDIPILGNEYTKGLPNSIKRPFSGGIRVDDNKLLPLTEIPATLTKSSQKHIFRLRAGCYLPGLDLTFVPGGIKWCIALEDCADVQVDFIYRDKRPDEFFQALEEWGTVRPVKESSCEPFILHVTCKLRADRKPVFMDARLYREEEKPMQEAPAGVYVDPTDAVADGVQHTDQNNQRVRCAQKVEIFSLIHDAGREHVCQWFADVVSRARNPAGGFHAFDALVSEYSGAEQHGSLLETMLEFANGDTERAPPVLLAHCKPHGTVNRSKSAHLLDITSQNVTETSQPLFTSPGSLTTGLGLGVFRELQYQTQVYQNIRGEEFVAHLSFEPLASENMRRASFPVLLMVRAHGLLEQAHFPLGGTAVEFQLRNPQKPHLGLLDLEGCVHENQGENADLLGIGFNVVAGSLDHGFILQSLLTGCHGNTPTDLLAECKVRLFLDESDSGFKAQHDALVWQLKNGYVPGGDPYVARVWNLFFRDTAMDPNFTGDLLTEFDNNTAVPMHERDARRDAAISAGEFGDNAEQAQAKEMFMRAMVENALFIDGPVACGKTKTMMWLVYSAACLASRSIMTAKSNLAVDNMCTKFLEAQRIDGTTIDSDGFLAPFRIVLARARTVQQEAEIRDLCLWQPDVAERLPVLERLSLAYLAYREACALGPDNSLYMELIERIRKDGFDEDTIGEFNRASKRAELHIANTCDVLAGTTATVGRLLRHGYNGAPTVVFDETSQITLPELFLGLAYNRLLQRVVFAGDPKQTGPALATKLAALNEWGSLLSLSIFNCPYVRRFKGQTIRLLKNYRLPPMSVELVNLMAYSDNPLQVGLTGTNKMLIWLDQVKPHFRTTALRTVEFVKKPVVFLHVESPPAAEEDGPTAFASARASIKYGSFAGVPVTDGTEMALSLRESRLNPKLEAAVVDIYSQLVIHFGVSPVQVTVLSFYKSFVESIAYSLRTLLRENGFNVPDPRMYATDALETVSSCVSTIDKYQGEENEIVLVACSSFQEDALSWVTREERLNVAASRAKGAVIFMHDWNRMTEGLKLRSEGTRAIQKMKNFALDKCLVINYDESFPANLQVKEEVPGGKRDRNASAEGDASSFQRAVRAKQA